MKNCHENYCSAWSKLNTENCLNTNPPQTFRPLSRGVEGRVVATSTLMAPEEAEKYEKKAGEFLDIISDYLRSGTVHANAHVAFHIGFET